MVILLFQFLCVAEERPFKIVSSSSSEIILEYIPQQYQEFVHQIDGIKYISFQTKEGGLTSEEGKPQLPEEGTLIGIPPNSSVKIEIIESKFDIQTSERILPAPAYKIDDNDEAVSVFQRDAQFYETHTQFYPDQIAQVVEIAQLREQRVAKIIIHPIQYNPATQQIKRLIHLQVRCRFVSEGKSSPGDRVSERNDQHFEPLYKNLIFNYSQAKPFRSKSISAKKMLTTDSTAWFVPGRLYFRLPAAQDGMYRLTFLQLDSAGLDMSRVNLSSLAMYTRGVSVPMFIDSSSSNPNGWYIDF